MPITHLLADLPQSPANNTKTTPEQARAMAAEFNRAMTSYKAGNISEAADICRNLLPYDHTPDDVVASALQLLSLTTTSVEKAMIFLKDARRCVAPLQSVDPVYTASHLQRTEEMMKELESYAMYDRGFGQRLLMPHPVRCDDGCGYRPALEEALDEISRLKSEISRLKE